MDPQRWQRIGTLFARLADRPPAEREAVLAALDPDLRDDLTALLAAHDAPDSRLAHPAAHLHAALTDQPPGPAPEDTDDLTGATLGPYQLRSRLGTGGMGVVYAAEFEQAGVRRHVAVKVIRRGLDTEHVLARFRAEQRILASLDHPGIARLHDVGVTSDGRPYLVMELVDGVPIDRWCQERDLSLAARLRLMQEVCRTVHHAHRALVVHRDLKPSNLLVTPEGRIKLLDFGIAKLLAPEPDRTGTPVTLTGLTPMTPGFASPEQVRGEVVTTAVDVYGLGVLLFLLLADRHPHDEPGRTRQQVLEAITSGRRPRPSDAAPDRRRHLRGDLDLIVQVAMHPDPQQRYGSALALAEDLGRHLAGRPVVAHRDSWTYTVAKFVGRNRAAVTVAAAALTAVIGFGVATGLQAQRIARQADQIRAERDRAEQVQGLVMDMFALTDPLGSDPVRGDTLRVRDFLRLNQETLLDRLADQPDLQARFTHLLARLQGNLGRFEAALPLVQQGLEVRRTLHAGDHPDLAASLDYLGTVRQHLGEFAAAEAAFREALAMRRRLHGEQHADVAESLNNVSGVLWATDRFDSSLAYDRAALAIRRQVLGDRDPETVQSLNNLGASLLSMDRPAEAEPLLRQALDLRTALLGADHPQVANTTSNLARALLDLGHHAEAEALLRRALATWERTLGPDHFRLGGGYYNLAHALKEQGRLADAAAAMAHGHRIDRAAYPADHPYVADSALELGRLLSALERWPEATVHLQTAARITTARHGPDHEQTRTAQRLLARAREASREANREASRGVGGETGATAGAGGPR